MDVQVSAADGIGMVKERLSTLTWRLHNDLANEVLMTVQKKCSKIVEKIYQKGNAMVGLKEAKTFLNAVRNTTGSVATTNDGDLMNHYRMFVANLETLFIKSCKKIDSSILNSKEIIQSILKKENIALFIV